MPLSLADNTPNMLAVGRHNGFTYHVMHNGMGFDVAMCGCLPVTRGMAWSRHPYGYGWVCACGYHGRSFIGRRIHNCWGCDRRLLKQAGERAIHG